MKVVKKPLVLDAWETFETYGWRHENLPDRDFPSWIHEAWESGIIKFHEDNIEINTMEGVIKYPYGYIIIKGIKGELYGIDSEVFEDTYDIVKDGMYDGY